MGLFWNTIFSLIVTSKQQNYVYIYTFFCCLTSVFTYNTALVNTNLLKSTKITYKKVLTLTQLKRNHKTILYAVTADKLIVTTWVELILTDW